MWSFPIVIRTAFSVFSAACVATIAANSTTPFYYEYVDESNVDGSNDQNDINYPGQDDGTPRSAEPDDNLAFSTWTIVGISCGGALFLIILVVSVVVICVICLKRRRRNGEKAKPLLPSKDSSTTEQAFSADDFQHKGPLEIKREDEIKLDTKSLVLDDGPNPPPADPEAHFRFEEKANFVYDIGSEVERIV
ncbi:hypothetical protein AAVH_05706 [Aphelenchoides avenae]|nr:hypothetical protein AAVH_05706 [Aphelenchus avenae]